MERLKMPLDKMLKKWGLKKDLREKMAMKVWGEAMGGKLASLTRAVAVHEGVLYVQVRNSSWAQHLSLYKPTLIKKINVHLGARAITDIRFKVGYSKSPEPDPGIKPPEASLNEEDRAVMGLMFSSFTGEDTVKEKLMDIRAKDILAKKKKEVAGWLECGECGCYISPQEAACPLCTINREER